jgi:hypothetical protein
MPGFLGGSTGGTGTGGEITFPKEFIDPVTKLRVSQPENLIDTDFEYGLQPTKWETVELINNTPSFFSKSGDTTIPGIVSVTTNNGTREITVTTALEHNLAPGIPINVTGTKSVTADGAYIVNSVPNPTTFTYLCRDNQDGDNSIEDLYTSIISGEFFQGSQLRISDAEGIITDGEPISTLTVKTDSVHGFGTNTPFYFLNLNSTISQEFEAANTAAKSFDASNSATAQTFDGSNTLSTINIDWSNSATLGGTSSSIDAAGVNVSNDTITVSHAAGENFVGRPVGTPLYYDVTTSTGYFFDNPRGVVFLKELVSSTSLASTFKVSAIPDGTVINLEAAMTGTFQVANQARGFAGNNVDTVTQTNFTVIKDTPVLFDGGNQGFVTGTETNGVCSVEGYSGTILVSVTAGAGLDYYVGAMVKYEASGGSAPPALTSGNTYFIASFATTVTPNQFRITLKEFPDSATALAPTGGTATTQTFTKIGVSLDKDVVHVRDANFVEKDMVEYSFPAGEGGRFEASTLGETKLFYFISKAYDAHNYQLSEQLFAPTIATGGTVADITSRGLTYRTHTFPVGTTNFVVSSVGTNNTVDYLIVAGGGGGGGWGGGGGGGGVLTGTTTLTAQTYSVVVGGAGAAGTVAYTGGGNGGNSSAFGLTAVGGGGGGWYNANNGTAGGSGGGGGSKEPATVGSAGGNVPGGAGTAGQGFAGGTTRQYYLNNNTVGWYPGAGGGGGAGGVGGGSVQEPSGNWSHGGVGGAGLASTITGDLRFYGAGGGGHTPGDSQSDINSSYYFAPGGSFGVGGDGGNYGLSGAGSAKSGQNGRGGGGGGTWGGDARNTIGTGGTGTVILRYQQESATAAVAATATGGTITTTVVGDTTYRIHAFTATGANTFTVTNAGNLGNAEYLVVGGGGGGASWVGGGGGGGGFLTGSFPLAAQSYTCTIGAGGRLYENGGSSSIAGTGLTTITALGGGHGGGWQSGQLGVYSTGSTGSSSGGAGAVGDNVGGTNRTRVEPAAATAGQGYQGGTGVRFTTDNANSHSTGGGGGAGGPGVDGSDVNSSSFARASGGQGRASNILGTTYFWGGGGGGSAITSINSGNGGIGGGGGAHSWAAGAGAGGTGGLNNGTAGGTGSTSGRFAGNGGANTGGGGGGGYTADGLTIGDATRGGIGGSGFIAIRYPIAITGIL